MTTQRTVIVLTCVLLSSGCTVRSPDLPTLADGFYTMESSIKKTGIARDYGGSSQCKVTIHRAGIRIEGLEGATNAWFEGTLTGRHIVLTVQQSNPDPIFAAMKLRQVWEGQITADNFAEGTMTGYAGTNVYLAGTWRLTKTK